MAQSERVWKQNIEAGVQLNGLVGQGATGRAVRAFLPFLISLTHERWLEIYHPFEEKVVKDT